MKKIITSIPFVLFAWSSMGQTLQTVTNNGNTTTLGIKVATLALNGGTLAANVPLNINTVPNGMSAFFGNDQNAVAIGNRFPDIYFNGYFDGTTYRSLGAGFSGLLRYDNSSGNLDYYSTAFATIGVGTPVTYSNPFNIYGTGSMYCSGQGRFSGWYTSGESMAPAAEIGFDGTQATLLGYDRSNLKYLPLRLLGGNTGANFNFIQIDNTGFSLYDKNIVEKASIDSVGNIKANNITVPYNSVLSWNSQNNQYIIADANYLYLGTANTWKLRIDLSGNSMFNGTITTKQVTVTQSGWSDFVFDPCYRLPSLSSTAAYIKSRHHLPDMPSGKEITKNGLNLGDMEKKQMQKIEELTLYVISLQKQVDELKKELKSK